MSKSYLALGDSYTIGESVPVSDRFPAQTVARLASKGIVFHEPKIIAVTGWTTGDLLDALKNSSLPNHFDVVSLLIGVNNQYQGKTLSEYNDQFTVLLQQSIGYAGGDASHVVVLSIPDYSVTPFAEGSNRKAIARAIDEFNAVNEKIARKYHVHYLSVTEDSRKAKDDLSLVAEDGLHFSGKEYAVWAEKLSGIIQNMTQ